MSFQVIDDLLDEFRGIGFQEAVRQEIHGIVGKPYSKDVVLERVVQDVCYLRILARIKGDLEVPMEETIADIEAYYRTSGDIQDLFGKKNISELTREEFQILDRKRRESDELFYEALNQIFLESYTKATSQHPTQQLFISNAGLAVMGLAEARQNEPLRRLLINYIGLLRHLPQDYFPREFPMSSL